MMLVAPTTESGQATAIDLDAGRGCIVAWAARGSRQAEALAQERAFIEALAPHLHCPQILGWMDAPEDEVTWLALTLCEGTPLPKVIRWDGPLRPVSGKTLCQWGLSLVTCLQRLWESHATIPQLLPEQMVVTAENTLTFQRLLPFPQKISQAQSIGMVGQLLYYFATTFRYNPNLPWASRPITATNYTISPSLATFIESLVTSTTIDITFATFLSTLEGLAASDPQSPFFAPEPSLPPERATLEALAVAAGNQLAEQLRTMGKDLTLYFGVAGGVLVLSELFATLNVEAWRKPLAEGATRLMEPLSAQPKIGSLFLGEAGIALALLKAGDALGDKELEAAGLALAERVETLPCTTPDLIWGVAGRLKFHLWIWERTGDSRHLAAAQANATWLLTHQITVEAHPGVFWQDSASTDKYPYLGYGHGIAGIGDALLDLYTITRDPTLLTTIETIATTLSDRAETTFWGEGVNWHNYLRDGVLLDRWCHGASGVGIFWNHLAQTTESATAFEMVQQAAYTVAYGSTYLSPCYCHGLVGSIELLLDVHQATGDHTPLVQAWRLWHLLDQFRIEGSHGVMWLNHHLKANDPGLMVGYGGVVLSLLRLLEPARPNLLTNKGIWYTSRQRTPTSAGLSTPIPN